ncbi:MAG: exodeoxyribonuclease VII large subunit [Parcubacteria group bacterium RIFOXYD2_FULL_52_8]|nr:MAG: exodeoxyribonuclease VII large subunit [Parcubacteria group bacterium RIFOXYD2_FULL_52_8]
MQSATITPILSVSQFLDAVNLALESATDYEIQGEVTDFKKGKWISFTLKDPEDGSLLKCVMGEWTWRRVGVELEDGMQVKVTGNAKLNKKYGSFGMWVETIEPLGEGSLKKAYELLLKKLKEEGLFDRKRLIPECIHRIGVVSSRHGVVIHDFTKNLARLGYQIIFVDTRVEGEGAVEGIVCGVRTLNHEERKLDALVIIRGGGSLESMQAFNNESVVRAIFGSRLPVIVGIGHDVDVPLACLVADASASTPTATAVLINQSWRSLTDTLPRYEQRLLHHYEGALRAAEHTLVVQAHHVVNSVGRIFTAFRVKEASLTRALAKLGDQVLAAQRTVTETTTRLQQLFSKSFATKRDRLVSWEQYLQAVSPERNLRLGYSIVLNKQGKVVKSIRDVALADAMTTRVADGTMQSTITAIT